jgi:imidazolonepropionase
LRSLSVAAGTPELDAGGRSIIPGFVDAHTHLVFAGDRSDEFAARLAGRPYSAGGIMSTVSATRSATLEELVDGVVHRANWCLDGGTTTVEAKSGYGLTTESEYLQLRALVAAGSRVPLTIVPTFLAHLAPDPGFVDLVVSEMLPVCAGLAVSCDAFCDEGALTVDESRRVLEAGRRWGLIPRLHAEEPFVIALACSAYGLSIDEALRAATMGGAQALRRPDIGHLGVGASGDAVMLDSDHWVDLAYRPGMPIISAVIKNGVVVRGGG